MNKSPNLSALFRIVTLLCGLLPLTVAASCDAPAKPLDVRAGNWGLGNGNHRFQPKSVISVANASQLQLRWVFALGDGEDDSPHSLPVVTEDTIYIGSQHGILHALDRNTGCERWRFRANHDIRTAVSIYSLKNKNNDKLRRMLVFGGVDSWLYAIDAYTGTLMWRRQVDDQRFTMITGTPIYVDGKLIIGISSYEAFVAGAPFYPCCKFRGTVLALDARTGEQVWRRRLIPQLPKPLSDNGLWTTSWGPSGIPVWSRPAVDADHKRVFVGTGENYSGTESSAHSDAILALDLDNGKILWSHQLLTNDVWNISCDLPLLKFNCTREKVGPDMDFGAAPISAHVNGLGRVVFAGQKSGHVYALNAKDGSIIWQQQPGRGGKLGGVHWGMAYHPQDKTLYVPVNDQGGSFLLNPEGDGHPGIYAYKAKTGELRWKYDDGRACPATDCATGFSAAIMINEEVLAAATLDGQLVLLDRKTGAPLWQFDTNKAWPAVNAKELDEESAQGGSIDVHGPLLVDDMLIVQSGYGSMGNDSGNALMVFGLPPGVAPAPPADAGKSPEQKSPEPKPATHKPDETVPAEAGSNGSKPDATVTPAVPLPKEHPTEPAQPAVPEQTAPKSPTPHQPVPGVNPGDTPPEQQHPSQQPQQQPQQEPASAPPTMPPVPAHGDSPLPTTPVKRDSSAPAAPTP
jgi:polyvinyl alcohol dehydrogenase (cytochrome)